MPVEVQVALATGVLGCAGLVITGIFQILAIRKERKSKEIAAKDKELEEAKTKLDKVERDKKDELLQRQIKTIEDTSSSTQKDIRTLAQQVEKMKDHVTARASESEDGIRMITAILSKDARTRSNLIHMYARTEAQLRTLMEIETLNLRFSKDTASTLNTVGELLAKLITSGDDLQRLRKTLDGSKESQEEFLDNILGAQKQFFDQSHDSINNKELDEEIEKLNRIISTSSNSKKHSYSDEDDNGLPHV